jgi:hypothetical protein
MSIASVTTVGGLRPHRSPEGGRLRRLWDVAPAGLSTDSGLALRNRGLADGIRIGSEATSLKGTFSAYDYDALNPDVSVL